MAKGNQILISSSVPGTVSAWYRAFKEEENKVPDLKDLAIMLERRLVPSKMSSTIEDGSRAGRLGGRREHWRRNPKPSGLQSVIRELGKVPQVDLNADLVRVSTEQIQLDVCTL